MNKYDTNGDGFSNAKSGRIGSRQAIDLNGDFDLDDQEILFYMTRFAKIGPSLIRTRYARICSAGTLFLTARWKR